MSSHQQPATPSNKSNREVIIWVIVGVLVLALLGVALLVYNHLNSPADSTASPSVTPSDTHIGTKARVLLMQTGDCFNYDDLTSTDDQYAWVVDCSQPHDTEVFATGAITDLAYPTTDGWLNWGTTICDPAFKPYVGIDWFDSELYIFKVYPDQVTWGNEPQTRQMICLARDESGILLTDSIAGSNR